MCREKCYTTKYFFTDLDVYAIKAISQHIFQKNSKIGKCKNVMLYWLFSQCVKPYGQQIDTDKVDAVMDLPHTALSFFIYAGVIAMTLLKN